MSDPSSVPVPLPNIDSGAIARLDLQAGDILVIQAPMLVKRASAHALMAYVQRLVPGVQVLILYGGATAAVLRPTGAA